MYRIYAGAGWLVRWAPSFDTYEEAEAYIAENSENWEERMFVWWTED